MANLRLETPDKRDKLDLDLIAKIGAKPYWSREITKGQDEEGKPSHNLQIRFDNRKDSDEVFAFLKEKIVKIPVLKGEISKHDCAHDEPTLIRPCVISEKFVK